jgi:dTDP-4-dehydrorhamnose reductase
MTRILVTGASGLLGLNLALAVDGKQHQIIGVANTQPFTWVGFKSVKAELTEPGVVESLIEEHKPEVIIHCAAIANVDDCESRPDVAEKINAQLPGEIAAVAAKHSLKMVQISTDAVFDGLVGNYKEIDVPNPLSVYASTKLAGEKAVAEANPNALITRVNFYGWSMAGNRSLAEWFVNNLKEGKAIKGFTDITFCPMMVLDLTNTMMEAIRLDLKGTYHMVGPQVMSKYDFGQAIASKFGFDPALISPASVNDAGLKAARSPKLTLSTEKLVKALGHDLPDFAGGLEKFYNQYRHGYPELIKKLF